MSLTRAANLNGLGFFQGFTAKNKTVHERYRSTLIEWFGIELVEWLEGPHEAKHYSREELEEIAATYRRKTRELKKQRAA